MSEAIEKITNEPHQQQNSESETQAPKEDNFIELPGDISSIQSEKSDQEDLEKVRQEIAEKNQTHSSEDIEHLKEEITKIALFDKNNPENPILNHEMGFVNTNDLTTLDIIIFDKFSRHSLTLEEFVDWRSSLPSEKENLSRFHFGQSILNGIGLVDEYFAQQATEAAQHIENQQAEVDEFMQKFRDEINQPLGSNKEKTIFAKIGQGIKQLFRKK